MISAKTTANIEMAFDKEAEVKEAETLQDGRHEIRRRVNKRRVKKFTPKDGRPTPPQRGT